MPQIQHELKIRATPESIRKALVSADAVRAWHGGKVTANHQELRLSFADAPTFRWRVIDDATHDRVTWKCVEGPSDAVGTEARFSISPADRGRHLLELAHAGWPDERGSFRRYNTIWGVLLYQLRQYIENGATGTFLQ
jgi:hypothetical protein